MPAHRSLGRRLLRALASVLVLAAATVGLPWILTKATTAVWARGSDAFTHLLTRPDTGAAFVLTLCLVGWIAWASFMLSVVVEVPAQLRGRTAPRLPGLRLSQRAAGTLVSGIIVLFASSTLASATPALANPTTHPVATAAAPAAVTAQPSTSKTATTAAPAAAPTYTVRAVRPAESLWSIAEKLYGHGELYTKIADANEGRTMADGRVFHTDAPIQPGWILHLPDAPTTHAPSAPAHPAATPAPASHTVGEGETLWGIAAGELGDGERYKELFQANKNRPQADGGRLTDPDELQVGWNLQIPRTATPAAPHTHNSTPPPRPRPADDEPAADTATPPAAKPTAEVTPPHTGQGPDAAPTRHAPPSATSTADPATPPAPVPTISVPAQAGDTTAPPASTPAPPAPQPAADEEQDGIGVREAAGIGMLAAGGVLAALGTKRLLQRRRRRPGERPATAEHAAEHALHADAEPGSLQLLDLALRTLAHHASDQEVELPQVAGARITARTVELLLAPADTDRDGEDDTNGDEVVLAPFTPDGPGRWTLDRTQELLDPDDAAEVPAPYPGLVTLGTDPDGNHLLINLTVSRVLLLDGTPTAVRDTARVLALEAATSTWSDHSEILTVGLGDELPTLLPTSRLRTLPHLKAARTDLAELLLEQRQTANADDAPPRLPWTLVCAADIEEDEARLLAETLTAARELPVALVLPAQGTAGAFGAFDEAVQLAVGATGPQYVDALDSDLIVQSLPEADLEDVLDLLRTADEPAHPAEGAWKAVPPVQITVTAAPDSGEQGADPAGLPGVPFAALTSPSRLTPVPPLTPPAAEEPEQSLATGPSSRTSTTNGPEELRAGETEPQPDRSPIPGPEGQPTPVPPASVPEPPAGDPTEPVDLHAPEVQVLGPVAVTGITASGHGPKLAQLAAYLYFKPSSPDTVSDAMDPRRPWSKPTLQTRISELRNRLGADPDGNLYVPRDRTGIYKLSPKVRCDWDRFTRLAERGLTKGPTTGTADLEAALALVRGRPFGDTPPAWAATRVQEMLARITDTAHTLATWRRTGPRPDIEAARRTIRLGLDIDDSAELLYQDWMLIEDQAGNREGVTAAYETILLINRRLDVSTEPDTEAIYERITSRSA
ncbi:LysM peptidoglycan-binding domain-containing protein [Streptomyces sp. NPDC050600]|uniref:LysM peptidoglycan-binding domain-containing protein n=1 Tax=Streptomyces sp. NPDC050600 TaxID=3157213 RepID=UPI0034231539